MRERCEKPGNKEYHNYGARGIAVCARWALFENFLADMGLRPSPQHQIDRIDNARGYEPSNCRWVLPIENMRNKRSNRWIEFQGERLLISQWADRLGVSRATMTRRLGIQKWPLDRALTVRGAS